MRTNKSGVTEVAHVRSYGSDSYAENYDRIFGKKEAREHSCQKCLDEKVVEINAPHGKEFQKCPECAEHK